MRIKYLSIAVISTMLFAACGEGSEESTTEKTTGSEATEPSSEAITHAVDVTASSIIWRGEVAGVYGHDGTIGIQSGSITTQDGSVTGGEITIDMASIAVTDTASFTKVGKSVTDLEGHLTTEEFFNTAKFTTSTFEITSVEGNTVTGNLTIRDKTHEETFNVRSTEKTENGIAVSGTMIFNRQNYDVAWVHHVKDMILSDDIALDISLSANN